MIRNLERALRAVFGKRLCRAEKQARAALGVPAAYPEQLTSVPQKAETWDLALWETELEKDGLDAGSIIQNFRRGQ